MFERDGVLYRQVNPSYDPHYDRLMESGLAADLVARGDLIPHEEVDPSFAGSAAIGARVIQPERLPFISYPYEWSFSQLKAAALLTLRIQARALDFGMSLKDASAYNVQFLRGKPVFIDTLSFEADEDGRPWVAYRQFCQHFLAPLALMACRDVRLGQLLRVHVDGIPLDLASTLLPRRTRFRPSLQMHIHLHARLQKKYADQPAAGVSTRRRMSRAARIGWLENLANAIRSLRWNPAGTEWADYYDDTNYSEAAIAEKERLVRAMLSRIRPAMVWDLGANTGRFSRLASASGIPTIAFDVDPAAVERNYLKSASLRDEYMLPLVVDLTNPSTGLGWAGTERLSLQQRGPVHCAFALALVHHLAIGNNVPLARIVEWLAGLARSVVIEFVPKSDSQVQRLLASRADVFPDYTQAAFEAEAGAHFTVTARQSIPGTERVLYLLTSRRPIS